MNRAYRDKLELIRLRLHMGAISFDQAKEEAQPILNEMNQIAARIAKDNNKRPSKFSFVKLVGR